MASPQAERYLASLPYEDQQAIRAGGDVDAWYQAAVAAGAVPSQHSGQSQTQPKDPSQWNVDAGGGRNWWDTTAEQAGINPWQQDYKQEFSRTSSQALAQMSPEQRARWSMEHIDDLTGHGSTWDAEKRWRQWMYWQDSFDPNCPPNAPYQAEDGTGCVEKPDNSNKGYQEAQDGGAGGGRGSGGKGKAADTQASLNSPLKQMLINQGSFLGGYDPTRGDNQAGVRGGVVGGGGIWWQPNHNANAVNAPIPPSGPKPEPRGGGLGTMGGGTCPDGAPPQQTPCFQPPCPSVCSDGSAPRGGVKPPNTAPGGIMGGQGTPRGGGIGGRGLPAAQIQPNSLGGWATPPPSASNLTQTMAGLQSGAPGFAAPSPLGASVGGVLGQPKQPGGLLGAMTPLQKRKKDFTGMFGGVGNWFA